MSVKYVKYSGSVKHGEFVLTQQGKDLVLIILKRIENTSLTISRLVSNANLQFQLSILSIYRLYSGPSYIVSILIQMLHIVIQLHLYLTNW